MGERCRRVGPEYSIGSGVAALAVLLAGCGGSTSSPNPNLRAGNTNLPAGIHKQRSEPTPAGVIRAYYHALGRRETVRAYTYLAPAGRPDPGTYLAKHQLVRGITITLLQVGNYRIAKGGATYTCAGVQYLERRADGTVVRYGGSQMVEKAPPGGWRVVLGGSLIRRGGTFGLPVRASCARSIP